MLSLGLQKNKNSTNIMHFVGIGGIGMSGIAEIMHNLGYAVQGSDIAENNNTKRLESKNIKVFIGHSPSNIKNVSYLIASSAIKPDNLEIKEAKKQKILVISRAEMLAELMRLKYSVAVSGSHGKTTTTSLIACLFEEAKLDPTVINGGIINNKSTNAYLGKGDYLIAEADESDATFLKIPSTIAVITNIDPEHMEYYKNFDSLIAAFENFIRNLPFYGFAVLCIDHPVAKQLSNTITERRILTYGIDSKDANIRAYNIKSNLYSSKFDVKVQLNSNQDITIQNITIPLSGKHNILNALAAITIGIELDFPIETIRKGFETFQGVKRRFTKICEYKGAEIIDDYAHHPVEIAATLSTAQAIAKQNSGRVIAIFQPHRYSRLESLFGDFTTCFDDANNIYIMDVFAAGEKAIDGINSQTLTQKLKGSGNSAHFIADNNDIVNIICSTAQKNDIFVFMGAGSITKWANQLPALLHKFEK